MRLVDSHAHLNMENYKKDLDEVIARAKEKGIVKVLVVGIDRKTGEKALALKEKFKDYIEVALGFHPHEVKNIKEADYSWLRENIEKALAVGEIGLDFYKEYSPRELQFEHFERLLSLAKESKKPVVLHLRGDAEFWDVALSFLKPYQDLKMVFHCFTADWGVAKRLLEFESLISIPGVVTYPTANDLREAVKNIPLDRLILETDCPFLAPQPVRGKRNEPAYLVYTAEAIAELKGLPVEEVAEQTTQNFFRFFEINEGGIRE
jgi:TatD DNase family protein